MVKLLAFRGNNISTSSTRWRDLVLLRKASKRGVAVVGGRVVTTAGKLGVVVKGGDMTNGGLVVI